MDAETKKKLMVAAMNAAKGHLKLAVNDIKVMGQILVESTDNTFDDMAFNGVKLFEAELLKLIDSIGNESVAV